MKQKNKNMEVNIISCPAIRSPKSKSNHQPTISFGQKQNEISME